jgi:GntR family transcriptional regulator/MocR family aminotransferase
VGTANASDAHEMRWWSFEPEPGETLRAALARTLREAIVSGTLRAGVRLPASRRLAADLGVSRGVVTDAYDQLTVQGLLITRERSAPEVAAIVRPRAPAAKTPRSAPARMRYDLTATTPDVNLFSLRGWLATAGRVGRRTAVETLDYRPPGGESLLREALADHLGRTRGVIAEPEQILITQGTAQGIDLLLRVLRNRRRHRIAVEDPSHSGQHVRIRNAGLTLVAQRTDEDGLVIEDLVADAVLLTPAHQFPTGSVLPADRRRRLLEWAEREDGLVIEDDYDAEFRYDREPVRALHGLAPDRVVQLGTVSKTLAPALRLGWMVVPPSLLDDVLRQKAVADEFSPALDQLTLAEYLRSGDYDRQVRKARAIYRGRRDRLVQALSRALPEFSVTGIAAGLHVLLSFPQRVDDASIAEAAEREGIRVSPLSAYCVDRTDSKGLVIGYGKLHESAVAAAVDALGTVVWRELGERRQGPQLPARARLTTSKAATP